MVTSDKEELVSQVIGYKKNCKTFYTYNMKKLLIALGIVALIGTVSACKQKRCECITQRTGYPDAHSYEPKTGSSCVDTLVWQAADSSGDLIRKICGEEIL